MHHVTKIVVFVGFAVLYMVNNAQLEWLSRKISREMIVPYQNRQKVEYITPPPDVDIPLPTAQMQPVVSIEPTVSTIDTTPVVIVVTTTPIPSNATEENLWDALILYRNAHGKNDINKSEELCKYARSRADELTKRLTTNPESPLDNHDGFRRDADSGNIFEQTGFNFVGENLAYLPTSTSATQVIEWGWDSSPGHRSLQLSTDITNGCIAVIHPMYVGIFSY